VAEGEELTALDYRGLGVGKLPVEEYLRLVDAERKWPLLHLHKEVLAEGMLNEDALVHELLVAFSLRIGLNHLSWTVWENFTMNSLIVLCYLNRVEPPLRKKHAVEPSTFWEEIIIKDYNIFLREDELAILLGKPCSNRKLKTFFHTVLLLSREVITKEDCD
jgi:hypothetical protein